MVTKLGWRSVLLGAILVMLVGCGGNDLPYDEELSHALVEVRDSGEPVQLAELTSFSWDAVYVFGPYVAGEDINDLLGDGAVPDRYVNESEGHDVVIFLQEGERVHGATIPRLGIGPGAGEWYVTAGAGAWLVARSTPPDGALCLLAELPDDPDEPHC